MAKHGFLLRIMNALCQLYLTVTRGTPVVVQIMIIYFVIFICVCEFQGGGDPAVDGGGVLRRVVFPDETRSRKKTILPGRLFC